MTLSSAPWWGAPVLALAWMWTVPAQIFCAPTRAKLIAAARFMPGVCGVLVSSWSPGITLTPCSFQSVCSWERSWFSLIALFLLPLPDIAEALGGFNRQPDWGLTFGRTKIYLLSIYRRMVFD